MSRRSRELFAETVREEPVDVALACLLVGCEVEPDLEPGTSRAVLDALAATVSLTGTDPRSAAAALQQSLGERAGFRGSAEDYEDVRSSLLHEVLRRGRGLPLLLSVVWCEVASRVGVTAVPLGLPGHVLVLLGDTDPVVVDPFEGGVVVAAPTEPALTPVDLVLRLLTNIRALTARQARSLETARTRLWATELSLLLPRHPVALRRERAELLVRLGDFDGGATELEHYASLVEGADEGEADSSRRQARLARARLN